MSKIICDVCGASFPDTATNCPICGCAPVADAKTVIGDEAPERERTTAGQYAKGGRFAKSNVERATQSRASERNSNQKRNDVPKENNMVLIAVVVILLLAIVAVGIYVGVKWIQSSAPASEPTGQTTPSDDPNNPTGGDTILCTGVKLNASFIELTAAAPQFQLDAVIEPENTTNKTVIYTSQNPEVATVDANGLVVGVGYGQTTITATCGTVVAMCPVDSKVGTPPAPSVPEPSLPAGFILKLKTYKDSGEITIATEGGRATLYTETLGIKPEDITWTTSDPSIATVENGKVVGVDRGVAMITATIGDQTATCKVICAFDAAPPTEPTDYKISKTDVTIAKGETFFLYLMHKETEAKAQGVEWKADIDGIVEINGSKITGGTVSKLTKVIVSTEYEGATYSCVVYVKAGE